MDQLFLFFLPEFFTSDTDFFDSFMEGGRIRSSVALPREVVKPTVIDDNGEKITLKAGQEIFVNLVSPSLPTPDRKMTSNDSPTI